MALYCVIGSRVEHTIPLLVPTQCRKHVRILPVSIESVGMDRVWWQWSNLRGNCRLPRINAGKAVTRTGLGTPDSRRLHLDGTSLARVQKYIRDDNHRHIVVIDFSTMLYNLLH
jgi:hypothetical protein